MRLSNLMLLLFTMKTETEYKALAAKLNQKYPSLKAEVKTSPYGGRLEIEVATVGKAKAAREMFSGFTFTSGLYK